MWGVLNAFWRTMVLNLLVRIGGTSWQTWKQMSILHPYVTRKPIQAKDVWGKFASYTESTAMRHIKGGQNYYRTFKPDSTERCQIQLATVLLKWYSIVLGLTCLKSSFRKCLNKTTAESLQERVLKADFQMNEKAAKRNKWGRIEFRSGNSKWAILFRPSAT